MNVSRTHLYLSYIVLTCIYSHSWLFYSILFPVYMIYLVIKAILILIEHLLSGTVFCKFVNTTVVKMTFGSKKQQQVHITKISNHLSISHSCCRLINYKSWTKTRQNCHSFTYLLYRQPVGLHVWRNVCSATDGCEYETVYSEWNQQYRSIWVNCV